MTFNTLYQIPDAQGPQPILVNGIRLGVFTAGPKDGPAVVLCHGFPELAYSWRHQIGALAAAGYRVIAPDMRGYGHSDQPDAIEAYDLKTICLDLIGLLDHFEVEQAIFMGHDWGGAVVWHFPLRHSDRVRGVIGVNYPFVPRHPTGSILEAFKHKFGEDVYILQFQEPGVAEAVLEKNTVQTVEFFMRKPNINVKEIAQMPATERSFNFLDALIHGNPKEWARDCLLSEKSRQVYGQTFAHTGYSGALNWYRNFERNWEHSADLPTQIEQPCLMIMADCDVILPPSAADGMEQFVPNLARHIVHKCGHWTMQEHPDEVNCVVIDWLNTTRF